MPALTGNFQADFSNFTSAVDAAQVKLRGFEADSAKVGSALTRMTESFSGTKVMQQAALMTEAVERMGGVSKLTEADLRRIGPVVEEAVAKMTALGVAVPESLGRMRTEVRAATADIQKMGAAASGESLKAIGTETKNVATEMTAMGNVSRQVGAMVAGAFTVNAIVGFTRSIFEAADATIKMSQQTGMTIEQVQRLQYVSGQTSVSMEAMVKAAQDVTRKLGDDDEGLNAGLAKLNINVADFATKDSYAQFMQLAEAIGQVEDPTQRAADAAAVFGKNWKELLPILNAEIKKLAADAKVNSDQMVETIDKTGDAIEQAKNRIMSWGSTVVGVLALTVTDTADAWKELIDRMREGKSIWESNWSEMQKKADEEDPTGLKRATAAVGAFNEATKKTAPLMLPVVEGFKGVHLSARAANEEAAKLDKQIKDSIATNTEQAATLQKVVDAERAVMESYWKGVTDLKEKIMNTDAITAAKTWSDAVEQLGDRVDKFSAKTLTDLETAMQNGLAAMALQGTLTTAAADRYTQLMLAAHNAAEAMRATKPAVDEASGAITPYTQKLYEAARAEDAQAAAIARKNAALAWGQVPPEAVGGGGGGGAIGYLPPRGSSPGATTGGSSGGGTYTSPTGNAGGSGYTPYEVLSTTSGSGAGSSYYVPAKADGGPVAAGRSYFVGERGPELFTPGSSGMITPNGAGAVVVQNTFHIVDTESNIAARVSENILRTITQARRV